MPARLLHPPEISPARYWVSMSNTTGPVLEGGGSCWGKSTVLGLADVGVGFIPPLGAMNGAPAFSGSGVIGAIDAPSGAMNRAPTGLKSSRPKICPRISKAPFLSSGWFPLPHLGLWTQEGHPSSHSQSRIISNVVVKSS